MEAVTLRAPGTSRCPTDKGAAFICGVNGTLLIWTVDDDDGGDRLDYTLIHYHADSVGGVSVTRNGYLATLVNKSEDGQPASLFSVLTIFSSARKNLTIICSNNQDSQAVPFYLEIPGNVTVLKLLEIAECLAVFCCKHYQCTVRLVVHSASEV